ncbi:hypothetical protein ACM46_04870 [Chryseobacterium angstadtii]|uniref:Uncharacterized protein n=1 Tax=Chryseobacterium angstadtii TaxID=558151 RepID=A0A0J7IL47_9FLAO|nr:hypothetical protein ACM46_04870 [Chryseobacterium angstadtii]
MYSKSHLLFPTLVSSRSGSKGKVSVCSFTDTPKVVTKVGIFLKYAKSEFYQKQKRPSQY